MCHVTEKKLECKEKIINRKKISIFLKNIFMNIPKKQRKNTKTVIQ